MAVPSITGTLPIIADVHMHTSCSHGQASARAMYEACLAKGLAIIGFSEHSPRPAGYAYSSDYQEKLTAAFPGYVADVRSLQREGASAGVRVLLGLELDYIPGQEDFARRLIAAYPYDYVIGGLHFQNDWGFDGPANEWEALEQGQRFTVYARYYEDLAEMCRTGLFHIAAHPDLIKIHSNADFLLWLRTPQALPLIEAALQAMKQAGMAMEVSSAGLRKPCAAVYPCPQIMDIAARLHLPICFGSDAHCTDTPAYAFDQLARYAARFGYASSVIFAAGRAETLSFSVPPLL